MRRVEALRVAVEETEGVAVVAMCAATSRELASIRDRPNHLYLLDSMGLTLSVGIGLALANAARGAGPHVVVLDGDGSLLMNLGALATLGYLRPAGLTTVILDNASYASTAGLPTYAETIDIGRIAAACGLATVRIDEPDALRNQLRAAYDAGEPTVLHTIIEPGNEPDTPLLLGDPVVLGNRFQTWFATTGGTAAASTEP